MIEGDNISSTYVIQIIFIFVTLLTLLEREIWVWVKSHLVDQT